MRTIEDEIYGGIPVYVGDREDSEVIGAARPDSATLLAAALIGFSAGQRTAAPAAANPEPAASVLTIDSASAAALMRERLGALHKPLPVSSPARSSLADRMSDLCKRSCIGARCADLPINSRLESGPASQAGRGRLADGMREMCAQMGIGTRCFTPR